MTKFGQSCQIHPNLNMLLLRFKVFWSVQTTFYQIHVHFNSNAADFPVWAQSFIAVGSKKDIFTCVLRGCWTIESIHLWCFQRASSGGNKSFLTLLQCCSVGEIKPWTHSAQTPTPPSRHQWVSRFARYDIIIRYTLPLFSACFWLTILLKCTFVDQA